MVFYFDINTVFLDRERRRREEAAQQERNTLIRQCGRLDLPPPPVLNDVDHFCKGVAISMKRLSRIQQSTLQQRILAAIHEVEFDVNLKNNV